MSATISQPLASLIAIGAKQLDSHSWAPRYRGLLGIHAASRLPEWATKVCESQSVRRALKAAGFTKLSDLPRGCFVAVTELTDVIRVHEVRLLIAAGRFRREEQEFGDYSLHGFAWHLENALRLAQPISAIGHSGLWECSPATSTALTTQWMVSRRRQA